MLAKSYFKVNEKTGREDMQLGLEKTVYQGESSGLNFLTTCIDQKKLYRVAFHTGGTLAFVMIGSFSGNTRDFAVVTSPSATISQLYITINSNLCITEFCEEKVHLIINTSEGYFVVNEV